MVLIIEMDGIMDEELDVIRSLDDLILLGAYLNERAIRYRIVH
jgi:hypothetical protein